MKAMAIIGIVLAVIGGFFSVSMMTAGLTNEEVGFGLITGAIMLYFLIYCILELAKGGSPKTVAVPPVVPPANPTS